MKISRRTLARELVRLLKENPKRQTDILRQTAAYLIDTKQSHQAHLLVNDIANRLEQTDGHIMAEVTSAFPLAEQTKQAVALALKSQTKAQSVELNEKIAPQILGGIIVRTPKLELDTSVRRQLKTIAKGV